MLDLELSWAEMSEDFAAAERSAVLVDEEFAFDHPFLKAWRKNDSFLKEVIGRDGLQLIGTVFDVTNNLGFEELEDMRTHYEFLEEFNEQRRKLLDYPDLQELLKGTTRLRFTVLSDVLDTWGELIKNQKDHYFEGPDSSPTAYEMRGFWNGEGDFEVQHAAWQPGVWNLRRLFEKQMSGEGKRYDFEAPMKLDPPNYWAPFCERGTETIWVKRGFGFKHLARPERQVNFEETLDPVGERVIVREIYVPAQK